MGRSDENERSHGTTETPGWQLAVGCGILGWVLDAFDFFVVVFLFDALSAHFHVGKAQVVYTLTLTLAMRPLGAVVFGALADRFGRKRPLILCVLYFSATTVLSGLAPNFTVFVIMRALYGFGMGGYWGVGASYAMESAPVRLRGFLSGVMQSGYPMGYLLAAVAMQTVTVRLGWQSAFFIGAPVAVLIAVLAYFAPESQAWKRQQATSLKMIVKSMRSYGRMFLYLLALMGVMQALSHGTSDLYPDFIKSMPSVAAASILGMKSVFGMPVLYNAAAVLGAWCFGVFSQRIGRRYAMMAACLLALIAVPAWAFGTSMQVLLLGSCAMQFGAQGAFGVVPAHINELSPPAVRGLFPGVVYQLGVLLASPSTMVELKMRERLGYSWALAGFEGAVIFLLFLLFYFGPEALGRNLSEPDPALLSVGE